MFQFWGALLHPLQELQPLRLGSLGPEAAVLTEAQECALQQCMVTDLLPLRLDDAKALAGPWSYKSSSVRILERRRSQQLPASKQACAGANWQLAS